MNNKFNNRIHNISIIQNVPYVVASINPFTAMVSFQNDQSKREI